MKPYAVLLLVINLVGCQSDDISPENVSRLTFRQTGTIAGISHELILSDEEQLFRGRQCVKTISYSDWRGALHSFDWQAFESLPTQLPSTECCDQGNFALTIEVGNKVYQRVWSSFTPETLPESIQELTNTLGQRAWTEAQTCR